MPDGMYKINAHAEKQQEILNIYWLIQNELHPAHFVCIKITMVTRSGPNAWFADGFFSRLIFTLIQSQRLNGHLSFYCYVMFRPFDVDNFGHKWVKLMKIEQYK